MKIIKLKTFKLAIGFFFLGILLGIYANMTTYIDSQNILHENLSTPLSAFSIVISAILFFISFIFYIKTKTTK